VLLCAVAACGRIDFDPDYGIAGLVVCYPMDDDPSRGHVRATVPAYDATCAACPTASAGHDGGAYTFAGAQSVELPAIGSALVGATANSVTVWARLQDNSYNDGIVSKPLVLDNNTNAFKLETAPPGIVLYETSACGTAYDTINASGNLAGAWHHLATTWDGATKRLYVDGVLNASETTVVLDSDLPVELGADIDTGLIDAWMVGDLDDVCFWNRALDDIELASLASR